MRALRPAAAVLWLALLAGCAPKAPPAAPVAPQFPEFMRPPVAANAPAGVAADLEQAWSQLQAGNMGGAERTYTRVLRQAPGTAAALAGRGYVALARDDAAAAVARFEEALAGAPGLAAALVGRGQALLRLDRPADALSSFEAAVKADPSLDLAARIETLRFRVVETTLAQARALAQQRDWDGARAAYEQTLSASPDSAVLYRELALVERQAGLTAEADAHLGRALALDPGDRTTHLLLADIREEAGDLDGAIAALEAALRLEASAEVDARLAGLRERADLARLPERFQTLGNRPEATRGDLAVALAVRLPGLLARAPERPTPVITDLRGHWARPWILTAVRSGVLDSFPNHTFQPDARLRRADMAEAAARVLRLLVDHGDRRMADWQRARPAFSDLAPPHPAYQAAAQATASGVLASTGGAFRPGAAVSGQDVLDAVDALQRLAGPLAARDRRLQP